MWRCVVAVDAPSSDQIVGIANRREQLFVEALFAQSAIKALNKAILHGLCWRDEMPTFLLILLPIQHHIAGRLSAIITDRLSWKTSYLSDPVKPCAASGETDISPKRAQTRS